MRLSLRWVALLLVACCGGAAALRVAPVAADVRRLRARSARMAYSKVVVDEAESRKKNPTAADRPDISSKFAGVKANDRDTKKNSRQ